MDNTQQTNLPIGKTVFPDHFSQYSNSHKPPVVINQNVYSSSAMMQQIKEILIKLERIERSQLRIERQLSNTVDEEQEYTEYI